MSSPSSEITKVGGHAGIVGIFTLLSRIFGLLRDTLIAYLLGAKEASDAFYVAFRIPNLLRRLLAEGCLTISFIPVFSEVYKQDPEESKKVASYTFTLLFLLLFAITVLGVIFAGSMVHLMASGFQNDPEKYALTVTLTRITFPYIFLVSLGALAMGILNALKNFVAPAASPILLNIGIILGGVLLGKVFGNASLGLAWGVILGGLMQVGLQIPVLKKMGFLPHFAWNPKHPSVQKIMKLMLPSIYGSAVYQLNILAINQMASYLATGVVSYLWYADRVMEFPLGVFAISLATVILPALSDHAADGNIPQLKKTFREGLKLISFINLPAMVGLVVLAPLIIATLFQHGHFSSEATHFTAETLQFFALGLPFVSGTRVTASAFYALQDSKSPVRAANFGVLTNIVMGFTLAYFFHLGHRGLALGVASGSVCNFLLHILDLRKKIGLLGLKSAFHEVLKMVLAAALMGVVLFFVQKTLLSLLSFSVRNRLLILLTLMFTGVGAYTLFAYALKISELDWMLDLLKRKLRRTPR